MLSTQVSSLIFASFFIIIPALAIYRGVSVFESFTEGGKHGFEVVIRIIPFIVGMYVAIGMLQASGFFDLFAETFAPFFEMIGFPSELLPLALIRPITGSGSIAVLDNIIQTYGPDSLLARTAATILGSTETTFYVIAVYFAAVNVKKYRHAVLSGLLADAAGIAASVVICRFLFS